ncbi:heavy metal translocating P-type ATPase [Arcticibacterium luteifluviistationis]|uniref:ATPase n=1 Tax=Arcticibacterium luteifluviistationis TaxID=1784714 RepID=A0A2Z4GHH1_9BACT|nr:heavy metal translocating P-type ATPase metal-binding domain-containing protein [Arcticibacterium luteifluviistationis]AWW00518.1 ATPase [Arcticibacterium luteifluviistationis]
MPAILEQVICHHCGEICQESGVDFDGKDFCCVGCKTVYEILSDKDLCTYYDLNQHAGVSLKSKNFEGKFEYLGIEEIVNELLDFKSQNFHKLNLYLPDVHCSSCVWLLENLQKVKKGVISSKLNFTKKELELAYRPSETSLKEIVELLATLGYEPLISLNNTANKNAPKKSNRLIKQIAVVGFCAGNIMLLSFPEYFNLDLDNAVDSQYQAFFLYLNVLLALPVYFYGAWDYLKGAYISIKELIAKNTDILSVDIPISLGISALFFRSLYESFFNHGGAYWDSLAGLVFFLLIGKWTQTKTFEFLSFERNYKSYFPLAVQIISKKSTTYRTVESLKKDEVMLIHNEELIPADSVLMEGKAYIDYSFVTGESEPIRINEGELVYAGGRQKGDNISLRIQKEVSQSYLTQLWNNAALKKNQVKQDTKLSAAFTKYFTYITLAIAISTGVYWQFNDPSLVWPALTAVLMVACPCALTLSMPFTMGTVMNIFGRNNFYVKNPLVIQQMSEIDQLIFDKTGTLTKNSSSEINFIGEALSHEEITLLKSITKLSLHPISKIIFANLTTSKTLETDYFFEHKGAGLEAIIAGKEIKLGNADFLNIPNAQRTQEASVYLKIGKELKGYFVIKPSYRAGLDSVLQQINGSYQTQLLSGDNSKDRKHLEAFFKAQNLHFGLKPQEKLDFIADLQNQNQNIMMLGDGLNDAGALGQSDVGIAISENTQAFTPASDAILDAEKFSLLPKFLLFSKKSVNIVKLSFLLSLVYNFVCIGWAVTGQLSPVYAAIFMPLSSISVVLFAILLTHISAKKLKLI